MLKFVKQSVVPLGLAPSDENKMLAFVEAAGRTAYRSEAKISEDSATQFVTHLKNLKHFSVFEHSSICFKIKSGTPRDDEIVLTQWIGRRASYHRVFFKGSHVYISANVRAWLEDFVEAPFLHHHFQRNLQREYPLIFGVLKEDEVVNSSISVADEVEQLALLKMDEYSDLPVFGFEIITDRGISLELVRHRVMGVTQESSRYVNYNNKGFEFILPQNLIDAGFSFEKTYEEIPEEAWIEYREYDEMCKAALEHYKTLSVRFAHKPQVSRDALPNLLKTKLVMSGRWSGWKHFIRLRDSSAAHPRIRLIAQEIKDYFSQLGLEA